MAGTGYWNAQYASEAAAFDDRIHRSAPKFKHKPGLFEALAADGGDDFGDGTTLLKMHGHARAAEPSFASYEDAPASPARSTTAKSGMPSSSFQSLFDGVQVSKPKAGLPSRQKIIIPTFDGGDIDVDDDVTLVSNKMKPASERAHITLNYGAASASNRFKPNQAPPSWLKDAAQDESSTDEPAAPATATVYAPEAMHTNATESTPCFLDKEISLEFMKWESPVRATAGPTRPGQWRTP